MKNKYLIVNADDLGLTDGTNKAVIHCFKNGIVRSASIMPVGRAYGGAIKEAKKNPGLSIGVHLTLIGEKPLLNAKKIPTLFGNKGRLHESNNEFIASYMLRKIDLKQIRAELEAQIGKVADSGINISHLDSHQHLHMLPGIIDITIELAKKFKIKRIRVPSECSLGVKAMGLGVLSLFSRKKVKEAGISCADHFWGIKKSGRISEKDLLGLADRCREGVTEVMCHPAYIDDVYRNVYMPYYRSTGFSHDPKSEVAALTSKSVMESLHMNHIKLIGS